MLDALFSAPTLEKLAVSHCDGLTDNVFQKALEQHGFTNLMSLNLSCDSLSKSGLNVFLTNDNVLTRLHAVRCKSFTDHVIKKWVERVTKKNWNLTIFFEKYENVDTQ